MAKQATERRVTRKARARYSSLLQFCTALVVVVAGVMLYVTLTSRLTSLNYTLAKAQAERSALQVQTARLDDQIASLRIDDRFARIAARLHMSDPQQFAVVTLPPSVAPEVPSRLAFLSGLAGFFRVK